MQEQNTIPYQRAQEAEGEADLPRARGTAHRRAMSGTSRQVTRLPGWFVGSEQQICHWAPLNFPWPAPSLSWFIECANKRSGQGAPSKVQNLDFLSVCTPICLQLSEFLLKTSSGFGWLSMAKRCWKWAPLLYLHGLNCRCSFSQTAHLTAELNSQELRGSLVKHIGKS